MITSLWRLPWCLLTATLYKLATTPLLWAGLLVLNGHFGAAVWLALTWAALHVAAIFASEWHESPLTGKRIYSPPKGSPFHTLGNDQDGYRVDWYEALHPKWPWWLCAFVWCVWRNKLRNLPFFPALAFLHKPDPDKFTTFSTLTIRGVKVELWMHGWLTELKCSKGGWFLDIGPRLDQPTEWGAVSWAFRLFGRL